MRLLRLEILGFKSFVDKVTIHFDRKGISMVVGPNGCGKSNVVDAIRWALGEQSAKSLRGDQMEDVIFAGSRTRKPVSMAQVSLIFLNEEQDFLPKYQEFNEINITRRLYRSGESQYSMNKVTCRLADIRELFMDTGISGKGYAIIEQGQIAQIIAGTQSDKRMLFDRAAGIVKFKVKKKEAENRFNETKQNLLRVRDLLSELEDREQTLAKQAEEALLFLERKGRSEKLYREILAFKWQQALEEQEKIKQTRHTEQSELDKASLLAENLQAKLAALVSEKAALQVESETKRLDIEMLQKQLQEKDTRRQLRIQEESNIGEKIKETRERRDQLEEKANQIELQQKEVTKQAEQLQETIIRLKEQLQIGVSQYTRLQDKQKELRQKEERLYQDKLQNLQEQTAKREALTNIEIKKQEIFKRAEKLIEQKGAITLELAKSKNELEQLQEQIQEAESKQDLYKIKQQELQEEQIQFSQDLFLNQEIIYTKEQALAKNKARLESLEELRSSFSDFDESTSEFLQYMQTHPEVAEKTSFCGSLPQFLSANPESKQNQDVVNYYFDLLLFKNKNQFEEIKNIVIAEKIGRVSIFFDPNIDLNKPQVPQLLQESFYSKNTLFTNDDFIENTIDNKIQVDSSGTIYLPNQVIWLGEKAEQKSDLFFIRQKEIETIFFTIEVEEEELSKVKKTVAEQEDISKEKEKEEANIRNLLFQTDIDKVGLVKTKDEIVRTISRLEKEQETWQLQEEEQSELLYDIEEEKNKLTVFLSQIETQTTDSKQQEQEFSQEKERLEEDINTQREVLESQRIQLAEKEEQQRNLNQQVKNFTQEEKVSLQEWDKLTKDLLAHEEKTKQTKAQLVQLQDEIPKLAVRIQKEEQQWREKNESVSTIEIKQNTLVQENNEITKKTAKLESKLQEQNLKIGQAEEIKQVSVKALLDETGMNVQEVLRQFSVADFSLSQSEEERRKLLSQLQTMDKVNLSAKEEYDELKERLTFLQTQVDDLETSMSSILDSIQTMEEESHRRFIESFNKINHYFGVIFSDLFEGGEAFLRLSDVTTPLTSNIEISARMPGKRLQSLNLLSGGEKALTAIALIFAIFQNKPSPFCVLDEVDAPLDEANNERFNQQILKMTELTQFIIITHNKTTMRIANLLLGVTMQEPGSSKVVSVNIKEGLALSQ